LDTAQRGELVSNGFLVNAREVAVFKSLLELVPYGLGLLVQRAPVRVGCWACGSHDAVLARYEEKNDGADTPGARADPNAVLGRPAVRGD
jgi:hypothetical protein